jgi:hypothetical protein
LEEIRIFRNKTRHPTGRFAIRRLAVAYPVNLSLFRASRPKPERAPIHTRELNGVNPFDYLTELQRHAEELQKNPSEWMPWNCRETLARLATPAGRVNRMNPAWPERIDSGQAGTSLENGRKPGI